MFLVLYPIQGTFSPAVLAVLEDYENVEYIAENSVGVDDGIVNQLCVFHFKNIHNWANWALETKTNMQIMQVGESHINQSAKLIIHIDTIYPLKQQRVLIHIYLVSFSNLLLLGNNAEMGDTLNRWWLVFHKMILLHKWSLTSTEGIYMDHVSIYLEFLTIFLKSYIIGRHWRASIMG